MAVLEVLETHDLFSGGMFQGPDVERIPRNGAYDIVNGLIDVDEGVAYRRGGCAYKSTVASAAILSIDDLALAAGQRTTFGVSGDGLHTLQSDDTTPELVNALPNVAAKPVVVNGIAYYVAGPRELIGWAGLRGTHAPYSTGTVSVNQGDPTVTGAGTTWLANIAAGYQLYIAPVVGSAAIASVDDDTHLTLAAPWLAESASGAAYDAVKVSSYTIANLPTGTAGTTIVAAVANRLLVANGSQIVVSDIGSPGSLETESTNYHTVPDGAVVIGIEPLRGNDAIVFTTKGVFRITNLAFDLTDALGNVQQQLGRLYPEIVLGGARGVAASGASLVVPAIDNVYLIDGMSEPVRLGRPILRRYRELVASGAAPGGAAVYRNHYFLPMLLSGLWVDTLVCNLDTGGWTRWKDLAGRCRAYVQRADPAPKLLATSLGASNDDGRILDCTGCFAPAAANKNEADGATHSFEIVTRDFIQQGVGGTARKGRVWLEGVAAGGDSPVVTMAAAEGSAGSAFTSLTLRNGTAGPSQADAPAGVWTVNMRGKRIRLRVSSTSPWASLKVKAIDLFSRPSGRP